DLSTMALADLLQWADATRACAFVEVTRKEGLGAWLVVRDRMVVAASPPILEGRLASDGSPAAPGPGLRAATREALLDLFLWREGRFELRDGTQVPSPSIDLEIPI